MKKLLFLSVIALALFSGCGKETVGPTTDIGVYLNEIQATGGDWLEIYNSTSSTVNLAGFKVYDDATDKFTITSGSIPANGYFILYCDGTGVGGNASFKLSSSGETVYMEDNHGTLIDNVTFSALDNGSSYARFPNGTGDWKITGVPTQGATNGNDQAATISDVSRSPIVPGLNTVVIVTATVLDVSGISSVKLYSRKDAAAFAATTMTYSLGIYTGTIPGSATTGKIEYYIEVTNTDNVTTVHPSNAPIKTHFYLLNTDVLPVGLVINEFVSYSTSCCPDNSSGMSEYNDWIEIYNGSGASIDLNGYYLSDNSGDPFKFKIEGSTIIPNGGFLVVWADEQGSQGALHANFQLASATGEEVGLYYIDGRQIDNRVFGPQTENKSEARTTNGGTWASNRTPTQGITNN